MKLSVVTTLYKSAQYISEFHKRITAEAIKLTDSYEVIYVNDGSPDDSIIMARAICNIDEHVTVLDLSRNFGHHKAMMAGLHHAQGDRVFLIDVDLEEKPELLGLFWDEMENDCEIDVVTGEAIEKEVPIDKKLTSEGFYIFFNLLSNVKISNREMVARLMARSYVNALIEYNEREIFIPGIWSEIGFKQKKVMTAKIYNGNSSYTFKKKMQMAVDAITSFSNKPLIYIFYTGLLISLGALIVIIYLVIQKLLFGQIIPGYTSLMAVLLFTGGGIIFSLGIIGIYISKIFLEVKARPRTLVRSIYTNQNCKNQN